MLISSPKPRPIPRAAIPKFPSPHRSRQNPLHLVEPAPRGHRQKLNPTPDPKLSPTLNPMFNLPLRRLRPPVHRRFAVAAVVAAVAAVAVAANKPLRKPSLPLP
jgi:hypothetical protein